MPFDELVPVARANATASSLTSRATKRTVQSREIGSALQPSRLITNTTTLIQGPVVMASGNIQRYITTISNRVAGNSRVAVVPFELIFFESSIAEINEIPHGTAVNPNDWGVFGPDFVPSFKLNGNYFEGSDGENVVALFTIQNKSAVPKTIYFTLQAKVITYGGGEGQGS